MPTIAESILSKQLGTPVEPGMIKKFPVDFAFGHDMTLPAAIKEFNELGVDSVFDPDAIAVIPDHLIPPHNGHAAELYSICEAFAEEHGTIFYPQGRQGQEHVIIPEDGLVKPGDIVVGADSHTCTEGALGAFAVGVGSTDLAFAMAFGWLWLRVPETTRVNFTGEPGEWTEPKDLILALLANIGADGAVGHALEFGGETVQALDMDGRLTLSNMAIEAGGATGLVEPDAVTKQYANERIDEEFEMHSPEDPTYEQQITMSCDDLEPQIAIPESPANVVPISDTRVSDIEIDQAVIGSCTNSRKRDLQIAATILNDRSIATGVRLIITPGSQRLERRAIREGWTETFLKAGATMENPGCGACFGMRTGVLDENEVAISTTNRNFPGRMGDPTSAVYLASPAVAAASAVTGRITHPQEVI